MDKDDHLRYVFLRIESVHPPRVIMGTRTLGICDTPQTPLNFRRVEEGARTFILLEGTPGLRSWVSVPFLPLHTNDMSIGHRKEEF